MDQTHIRNFCIIAHIDHGKSTLADRMLEITNTVNKREMKDQYLDKIDIERERGITIKLQPARMQYKDHILNLIDTPGHIDFGYEVSRALAACEGAILLVDAGQGIQAQTLSNLHKAKNAGLTIIPVVNKIDLPTAHPEEVALDIVKTLGFRESEIVFTSGKTGEGVTELLDAIITKTPSPKGNPTAPTRALIFDSYFDNYKGVVAYVRVIDGAIIKKNASLINTKTNFEPIEIGYIGADQYESDQISTGEVGYIATGLKDIHLVRVGDTITLQSNPTKEALSGYKEPKPMVYANLFPEDAAAAKELREAVDRYNLTDASFTFEPIYSPVMGSGFRCGFLGLLHIDVVRERINREFHVATQITSPNVLYYVTLHSKKIISVQSPQEFPDQSNIDFVTEPWCKVSIFTRQEYLGALLKICENHRGEFIEIIHYGNDITDKSEGMLTRTEIRYFIPLAEVISNFFDQIKSVSEGYASLDYEVTQYREVDLVKLDVLLNKEAQPALARLVVESQAADIGEKLVAKLKEHLPRHQFKVPIQAAIGGNVVARADVPAMRKDVTAKLYGGDRTRKDKLLEKQAKGKKRMQALGRVNIPHEVYRQIITI